MSTAACSLPRLGRARDGSIASIHMVRLCSSSPAVLTVRPLIPLCRGQVSGVGTEGPTRTPALPTDAGPRARTRDPAPTAAAAAVSSSPQSDTQLISQLHHPQLRPAASTVSPRAAAISYLSPFCSSAPPADMSIRSLCRLAPLTRSTASSCVSCRSTRWPVPSTHARRVHVLHTISEVRQARLEMSASSPSSPLTLGFVPTMGALHSGHIDLVRASQKDNHKTVPPNAHTLTQLSPNSSPCLTSLPLPLPLLSPPLSLPPSRFSWSASLSTPPSSCPARTSPPTRAPWLATWSC